MGANGAECALKQFPSQNHSLQAMVGKKKFDGHWNYFPSGGKLEQQDFGMKYVLFGLLKVVKPGRETASCDSYIFYMMGSVFREENDYGCPTV